MPAKDRPRRTRGNSKAQASAQPVPAVVSINDDGSVATAGTFTSISSESTRGLHPLKVKELLLAVESEGFGGIARIQSKKARKEGYILADLLDTIVDEEGSQIFGERGGPLREKAGKYVDRWKGYPRKKYLALCHQSSVIPIPQPGDPPLETPKKQAATKSAKKARAAEAELSDISDLEDTPLASPRGTSTKKKPNPKPRRLDPDLEAMGDNTPSTAAPASAGKLTFCCLRGIDFFLTLSFVLS